MKLEITLIAEVDVNKATERGTNAASIATTLANVLKNKILDLGYDHIFDAYQLEVVPTAVSEAPRPVTMSFPSPS